MAMNTPKSGLRLGIDIGSTTIKLAVLDTANSVQLTRYRRHNAKQAETVCALLTEAEEAFGSRLFEIAVCGSGGRPVAEVLDTPYVQEVVANAAAVRSMYPEAHTAVELGGQDAKIIFFRRASDNGLPVVSDMRMNGSCAGGTGAFIDEIAKLLSVKTENFEAVAAKGRHVYDISGRCGVFAKTDIQPLLIQGADHEDIALSTFHAIAKQTICGLSQGLSFVPPVVFEGGPFTFNPSLVRVFAERLNLGKDDVICPEHAETIIAIGAAIAARELFPSSSGKMLLLRQAAELIASYDPAKHTTRTEKPFFISRDERDAFEERLARQLKKPLDAQTDGDLQYAPEKNQPSGSSSDIIDKKQTNQRTCVYIGIDSGSTTSKIAFIDESENVTDTFYANNNGKALQVVKDGLTALYEKYENRGETLEVLGLCATGYGELLFEKAFGADCHTVETVAHARGCKKYAPDVSFLLDIGGQDMKAIWMKDGVVTNIVLNEACSSGCGSFLENFAHSLGVQVNDIAEAAFNSENPAALGSRCTVFMNSTIVNEQRNGKQPRDIMAGLCRALIENVFTKVIRVSNADALGKNIVVQGGTFRNAAVLRAIEEYLGMEVTIAPYPGEMGAIGAALLAKDFINETGRANGGNSAFIGFDKSAALDYTTEENARCSLCANHCSRTVMTFNTGARLITGNRCERGNSGEPAASPAPSSQVPAASLSALPNNPYPLSGVPDMFKLRNGLLFKDYEYTPVAPAKDSIIGLPRILEFWESMPFWTTFFRALGFKIKISSPSSKELYEDGLSFVASDTVCFPAKLAHGHIHELAESGAHRIFMPYMMNMPSENAGEKSHQVCPIIKGYPLVIRNFNAPERRCQILFDTPVFHWYTERDKKRQVIDYATRELGVTKVQASAAFVKASAALADFHTQMLQAGARILESVRKKSGFAVVLAGRPYHADPFICHDISNLFTKQGIPVLTIDSLPEHGAVSLRHTRAELTNTFHAQMLRAAIKTAETPELEFAQIVSFGCGHDAILSDEVIRVVGESGDKPPLVLKVDESGAQSSLRIRVQSFIETVNIRRKNNRPPSPRFLPDAYPAKFRKKDKKLRTLLLPNLSVPASKLLSAILSREGYITKNVPLGETPQIKVGKKYTHNDICFPCQVVIGELISELQTGGYKSDEVAVAMMKLNCECRLAQYPALLRKALDDAGFGDVPIITNDLRDAKGLHPGFSPFGLTSLIEASRAFIMLDILEELRRKIRPYELVHGQTNLTFEECLEHITTQAKKGLREVVRAFKDAIGAFRDIPYDRSVLKPNVLVTGELLVAAHPGSNFHIEEYLERNGMETVFTRITDIVRKEFLTPLYAIKDFKVKLPRYLFAVDKLFDAAQRSVEKIAGLHPLYSKAPRPRDLYESVRNLIPATLNCGEGWLLAAEIVHHAVSGVRSVIILQPFGCLPNHVCGRGVTKRLKEDFPDINILPLDFDPDTGYANVENRLQMLIMNN